MENKLKKKKEKRFPFSIFHDLRQTKQASVLSLFHFCGFLVYRHFKIIWIFLFSRFPQNRKAEFHAGPFTPLYFFYAVQLSISFSAVFCECLSCCNQNGYCSETKTTKQPPPRQTKHVSVNAF